MAHPETVQIDGIQYVVEIANSPEDHEREERPNAANIMRQNGHAFHLYLRRPKGTRRYFAVQTTRGAFSTVTSLRGF